ncbi:MAG: TonB-dependent receptor [Tannerellaceae bacterium]|nr:TonB-dependent receptor [Tannerellaceae bacterium]
MRITFLRLLLCLLLIACHSVASAQVSVSANKQTIKQVMLQIEKSSGFSFFYSDDFLDLDKEVYVNIKDESIESALNKLFQGTDITYKIDKDKHILLAIDKTRNKPATKNITGKVVGNDAEPIIGASVSVKGSSTGTITDIDGRFSLETPAGSTLSVSYIGYATQEIKLGENTNMQIVMQENLQLLDEVVVVGYSTRKRTNLTGAVATLSSEVMQARPVNNPLSALQGEIPGMLIQRYSGEPGNESFNMKVRGISTTNDNNGERGPLVIIDGVAGDINLLSPDDIESISILKDSQASIYGARASGGVFLVTTKSGKQGKPKISYSGNFAVTQSAGMMKSPTTYEMAIMDNEANIHNGAMPMYAEDYLNRILNNDPNPVPHPLYEGWMLFFTNTDWMKELLGNGFQQKHSLSISGGGDNSTYYLSAGYIDQRGVVKYANDNNKRYNLRLNYDYYFFDRVKLETKVSYEGQNRSSIGGVGDWVIGEGVFDMPNHPVYTPYGNYFAQGGWDNSVAMAKSGAVSHYRTNQINTNFKLIADVFSGFKVILQAGIIQTSMNSKDPARSVPLYTWDDQVAYYSIVTPDEANLTQTNAETQYRNYTTYIQYNKNLGKKHSIDAMGGVAHEENNYDQFSAWRDGFKNDLWDLNLGNTNNMMNSGGGNHWSINSYFGRFGYVFDEKYLFETNMRYDGSSRFSGADQRWGFFPGVSAGWRISKEAFMKPVNFINELKLRASYGETGNQEGIGLYDFIQKLTFRKNDGGETLIYPFGAGSRTQSIHLDRMVARGRRWETIINQNIGLDAAILKNRLDISFDYFWKKNKDMLIPVTYPSLLGAEAPYSNSGQLNTWGFEAAVGWRDKIGAVAYFAKLVLSDARNRVANYGGSDTYVLGYNRIREGYPVDSYFAYEFDGLIRTQAELEEYKKLEGVPSNIGIGDARFKDLNNDGKISTYGTNDDGDVKFVGDMTPRYNYGITAGVSVKGFDFSAFFQGVGKRTLFRTGEYAMPWSEWWRQPPRFYYLQTWNEDRPDGYYPKLSHGDIRHWNYQESTLQKINAAYVRLKNIQIGYTLPSALTKKAAILKARVYLSGQDLWEYHKVKGGWDPESADWGGNYPFQRYYSFGIDITF